MRSATIALFLSLCLLFTTAPAVAAGAEDSTGIVTGTVNLRSAKKYPTLVYFEQTTEGHGSVSTVNPVMDQKGKVFLPRVLPVLVGTTVEFLNSDSFAHNVFSPDGEEYDLGKWSQGEERSYTFEQAGVYTQLCRVHPEMVGYVVVLKTPYFAMADQEGKFRIPAVPSGTWTVKIWNERLRSKQLNKTFPVEVAEGQEIKVDLSF